MHNRTYYVEWEDGQAISLVIAGLICNVVRFIYYSVSWRSSGMSQMFLQASVLSIGQRLYTISISYGARVVNDTMA